MSRNSSKTACSVRSFLCRQTLSRPDSRHRTRHGMLGSPCQVPRCQRQSHRQGFGRAHGIGPEDNIYGARFAPQGEHQGAPAAAGHHDSGHKRGTEGSHRGREGTGEERSERQGAELCGRLQRAREEGEVQLPHNGQEVRQTDEEHCRRHGQPRTGGNSPSGKRRFDKARNRRPRGCCCRGHRCGDNQRRHAGMARGQRRQPDRCA